MAQILGEPPGEPYEASQEPTEPYGVTEVVTPSGLEIYYQAGPKRLYRIDGEEVPSVSAVRDILHKPALVWWGMKVGVEGVLLLAKTEDPLFDTHWQNWDVEGMVKLLTEHKLTVNHVRDKASDRGTSVHKALEYWSTGMISPYEIDLEAFPEEEQGYVQGVIQFIETINPIVSDSEVVVGSKEHGYAGRYDLRAHVYEGRRWKPTPRSRERFIPPGEYLFDLKTSKDFFADQFLQLAAYERASQESGYGVTDYQAVVKVDTRGTFDIEVSQAYFDDFLAVLGAYRALQRLEQKRRKR